MKKILVVLALTSSGITRPDILRVNNKTGQTIKVRFNEALKDIKNGEQQQFSGSGKEQLAIDNFEGSKYLTRVPMEYGTITIESEPIYTTETKTGQFGRKTNTSKITDMKLFYKAKKDIKTSNSDKKTCKKGCPYDCASMYLCTSKNETCIKNCEHPKEEVTVYFTKQ